MSHKKGKFFDAFEEYISICASTEKSRKGETIKAKRIVVSVAVLMAVLCICFAFYPRSSATSEIATLCLDPPEVSVLVGEIFTIDVIVDVEHLWGYDVRIGYDASLLDLIKVEAGPLWLPPSFGHIAQSPPIVIWHAGTYPLSGTFMLASITFKAKAEGSCSIRFYSTDPVLNGHDLATIYHGVDWSGDWGVGWPIPHTLEEAYCTTTKEAYVGHVNEAVQDIPDELFTKPEDAGKLKEKFSDQFHDALENIVKDNYEHAIKNLEKIKEKLSEEVLESDERQETISMIDDLVAYLKTL